MPKHFSTIWKIQYKDELNGMFRTVYVETEKTIEAIEKLENLYTQKPKFTYISFEQLELIK